jgi:hypothetical protein
MDHILKQIKHADELRFTYSLVGGLFGWIDNFSKKTDIPTAREEYDNALICLRDRGLQEEQCATTFIREGRYISFDLTDSSGVSIVVQEGFPETPNWRAHVIYLLSASPRANRNLAADIGLPLRPFTQFEGFNKWINRKIKEQYYGKR